MNGAKSWGTNSGPKTQCTIVRKSSRYRYMIEGLMFWCLLTICCLILASSSIASLNQCYSSFDDISTREILGSWVKGSFYDHPGVFAHERNVSKWWEHACPAQSRIWSCRRHDADETSGHGYEAYSQRFVPNNCALNGFDPFKFMHMLRNRRLVMIGDSITVQFYTMIICSLHGVVAAEYNLNWLDVSSTFGREDCRSEEHCHLQSSSVYYPHYNTTIIVDLEYGNRSFSLYSRHHQLTPNDVVVFNRGLHVHDANIMKQEVRYFFDEYLKLPETHQPMLIWYRSPSTYSFTASY
eukprot:gene3152-3360_t